jgi:hypothetical protein
MKKIFKNIAIASILAMGMSNAMAVPATAVTGLWSITFYLEPNLTTGGTQKICFTANGTWASTTFANWNGDWLLKGDRLRWYGDTGSLGTAEFGQFSANTHMTGEFAHFRVPGAPPVTSSRGNYIMTKVSNACSNSATATLETPRNEDPSAR